MGNVFFGRFLDTDLAAACFFCFFVSVLLGRFIDTDFSVEFFIRDVLFGQTFDTNLILMNKMLVNESFSLPLAGWRRR